MTTTESLFQKTESGSYRFNDSVPFGYLTFEELEQVEEACRNLRKGQKRNKGCPPFLLLVDDELVPCRSLPHFLEELSGCHVDRSRFELFRNFNKGITAQF